MARINVEDDLFGDFRFENLVEKLGDLEKAIGKMVRLWKVAQKYWVPHKNLIPHEVFERGPWQTVLEVGLATKRETGYYVSGSEHQFQWLIQCALAGKKSGENRRVRAAERGINDLQGTTVERTLNGPSTRVEPLTLTLTPTLTHISDTTYPHPTESRDKTITLANIWNQNCGTLARVSALNKQRRAAINARLKENSSEEYWTGVVKAIAASPFCNGENDRAWRANFDFLIKPGTHLKVSEGAYMRKNKKPTIEIAESLRD